MDAEGADAGVGQTQPGPSSPGTWGLPVGPEPHRQHAAVAHNGRDRTVPSSPPARVTSACPSPSPKLRVVPEPGVAGGQQVLQERSRLLPGSLTQAHEAVEGGLHGDREGRQPMREARRGAGHLRGPHTARTFSLAPGESVPRHPWFTHDWQSLGATVLGAAGDRRRGLCSCPRSIRSICGRSVPTHPTYAGHHGLGAPILVAT